MKKAKNRFDGLVEKIREGENINFGQMEEVFAQAFLSRFLNRLSSEQERSRVNKFYQEHLVDQESLGRYNQYDGPDDLSSDQQIQYELELARSVIGTLGVRPTTEDLSHYVEHALRESDWVLLDKVLSLTKEGDLQEGTLEMIAVKELEDGRVDSYRELKKQFPTIEVSSEQITPIYEKAISETNLKKLGELQEATNITIPLTIIQKGYENLLSKRDSVSIDAMHKFKGIVNINPLITSAVKSILRKLYEKGEGRQGQISLEDVHNSLDPLLGIFSNSEFALLVQKSALEADEIGALEDLYLHSQARLSSRDLIRNYSRLDKARDYLTIAQIMEVTRFAPKKAIFSRTASAVLSLRKFDKIRKLIDIAGTNPKFEQEVVDSVSSLMAGEGNIAALEDLSNLGARIDNNHVYLAACRFLARDHSSDFDYLEQKVNDFCKIFGLKPSPKVSAVKLSRLTGILENDVDSAVGEFTCSEYKLDPLTPVHRMNMSYHNKFKSKVRKLLRGYLSKAKKIKKENSGLSISERNNIDKVYSVCLEIALAQCLIGDEKYIRIHELSETLGVAVSRGNVRVALYNHVRKNSESRARNNPEGLITKLSEAGLSIEVDTDMHNQVAQDLVIGGKKIERTLGYLKKLTGYNDFSIGVSEAARTRIVKDFSDVNLSEYNILMELAGDIRLSENEKERVSRGIIYKLEDDPIKYMRNAERIAEITGVQLHADSWDLKTMVRKYFETGYWRTKPSQIARLVNQKLDQDQVFNRTIKLINDNYLKEARELYFDTGIHPTEQGARNILDRYNRESQGVIAQRLNEVFGSDSGLR